MSFLIFIVLALIVAALHLYRERHHLTRGRIAEILLLWLLVIAVGLGSILAFFGHTGFAASTAESIGWPAGNPFQTEVAAANLAIGIVGVLCYWIRGNFWVATVIMTAVFMLGAAAVHIQQIIVAQNYSPDNAGIILYTDILTPLVLIALLAYRWYASRQEREMAGAQPRGTT
jgi:hypothetical protein